MTRAFSSVECEFPFTDILVFTTQMGLVPTAVMVPKSDRRRRRKKKKEKVKKKKRNSGAFSEQEELKKNIEPAKAPRARFCRVVVLAPLGRDPSQEDLSHSYER